MELRRLTVCAAVVALSLGVAPWPVASAAVRRAPDRESAPGCFHPGRVLDLRNWKITLPVDDPRRPGAQPLEVEQPLLRRYALPPWFVANRSCDGVRFRNAVTGVHTPNSRYGRSELHEMADHGAGGISWSPVSGKHTMVIDQSIDHLPNDKPHVVAGQIHDSSDDVTVFRLEGRELYLTDGDDTHYKMITDDYVPGTRFQAKFEVAGGRISAYYNGVLQATLPATFEGAYFKAGAYTQANCSNSTPCDESNYGQVTIYRVTVTHS
ncbi:polysaccharide lyase family 7 protein [Saccharothrix algeriensis]|uniref:Polysaccharide lyase family 7 protein n=1 Tax=Saccharothrix algeriensis TaxID=173560 RepID=A0A8T8HXK3_9PSEU|nr:polysaccharide lyase family 7 protein [Saccharothrix algeriensis]MBM7814659.1 hypothetical protein [Saccharothrix algeriensis]QTR02950.1 polysaccharide lyase family 7 protein [Saccharothrix algeriensis]